MAAIIDSFTDVDNTLLQSHVSNAGQTWSNLYSTGGDLGILTNRIGTHPTFNGSAIYKWVVGVMTAHQTFSIDYLMPLTSPDTFYWSLTLRGSNAGGSFYGYVGIVCRNSGVLTLKINKDGSMITNVAISALDDGLVHTLTLTCAGSQLKLYVDSVLKLTASDTTYTLQGDARVNVNTASTGLPAGFYLDNASIDVITVVPPPPPLPLVSGQLWPRSADPRQVRPYPDEPPVSPSAFDEEFETLLPAKWTLTPGTAPLVYDIHSSWPSWLHAWCRGAIGAGVTSIYLQQVITGFPAGTPFSCTFKVVNGAMMSYSTVGIRVERLAFGSGGNDFVELDLQFNGFLMVNNHKTVAGTPTYNISNLTPAALVGDVFLHVQRNASDLWTFWTSTNGRAWYKLAGDITLAFAIGEIFFQLGPSGQTAPDIDFGIDWIRCNWLTL